jgi:gliding motility-associated-like protein
MKSSLFTTLLIICCYNASSQLLTNQNFVSSIDFSMHIYHWDEFAFQYEEEKKAIIEETTTPSIYTFNGVGFESALPLAGISEGNYIYQLLEGIGCIITKSPAITNTPPFKIIEKQTIEALNETEHSFGSVFLPYFSSDFWSLVNIDPQISTNIESTSPFLNECVLPDFELAKVVSTNKIFIPTAFSPNGDGQNDVFKLYGGLGIAKVNTFSVYNRWGDQLFYAENYGIHDDIYWDGKDAALTGVSEIFTYSCEIQFLDGTINFYKGDIVMNK